MGMRVQAKYRCEMEEVGCQAIRPSLGRIVKFGTRSRHHALESMMVRLSYLALVSASSSDAISWLRPRVHDAASTTIGILPPSLHRSMASAMDLAMNSWPWG